MSVPDTAASPSPRAFSVADYRAARRRLGAAPGAAVGSVLVHLMDVGSTQEEARLWLARGAPHGAIVLARSQSAGRGRRGRTWASPPGGGLWCTVILRRGIPEHAPQWITMAAAVAVCETARCLGAVHAEIKWPNDIITRRGKLAGVLGELVGGPRGRSSALVGIGLNIGLEPERLGSALELPATSLAAEGASPQAGREEALAILADRFERTLAGLKRDDPAGLLERWSDLSPSSSGRRVRVEGLGGGDSLRGTTQGIDPDGSLRLRSADGSIWSVRFGGTLRFEDRADPV